jgi:hypothetical protein
MDTLFNTFAYQPILARAFSNAPALPDAVARAAAENPDKAQHITSVWQFAEWLKTSSPQIYDIVSRRKPELLDAPQAVASGKLGAMQWGPGGIGGLGQAAESGEQGVITQWGSQLLDLAKGYMVYDAQKDLMRTNISRAERGLPPIDPGVIAPQVQVGVAPNVQTLMYVALAGLVVVGLTAALGGGRKRK